MSLGLVLMLAASAHAAPTLRVSFIDVGQGDAVLIVSPTGTSVLLDAGRPGAQRRILPVLAREGVETLDVAMLSHAHSDHIGGFVGVMKAVPTRMLLDPGFDHSSGGYLELLSFAEREGIGYELARRGKVIDLGGGATLEILEPREPLLRGTRSDCNSNSVIARLAMGEFSMLLTGDAEAPSESRLMADSDDLDITVLKVAHHGSEHSTSLRFLDRSTPEVAVISAGPGNSYGHPDPELTGRLESRGVPGFVTFAHGTVTLVTDGTWWKLHSEQWAPRWRDDSTAATTRPVARHPESASPEGHTAGSVYASRTSKMFHRAWCKHGLKRISSVNLVRLESAEAAEATGRKVSGDCGPRPEGWTEASE